MASRRAVVGTAAGSVILALGIASLVLNLGLREFEIDSTYADGEPIPPFTLTAPEGTVQSLAITGAAFETSLRNPQGADAQTAAHRGSASLEWTHGAHQASTLAVSSTGAGPVSISGTVYSESEPIRITFDLFVMVTGLIIIGFSAGFGRRRPRGF